MARILVTDGEQRSALAAVRSLGRAGHEVLVCSSRPKPLAGASRFAGATFVVEDPRLGADAFRESVRALVQSRGVEVLLPMTDVSLPLLFPLRDGLRGLLLPGPTAEAYAAVSDKRNLMEVARGLCVPTPPQIVVEGRDSAERASKEIVERFGADAPLVLKPARSAVVGDGGVRKLGVQRVDRSADVGRALQGLPEGAFPILAQERISGAGLGAFLLFAHGRVIASFGHRRIREKPPTGGVSVYREAVPLRDDIRAYSESILDSVGWTGVAMVEFKEDARTGTPYLMEVNGRFWGSLQLAIDAGVDFPRLLVETAMTGACPPIPAPKYGIRSRWLWGDVDHLLWILRYGRAARRGDPSLPGALTALGRFVVPWRPGDRFEVLQASDPRPFLRESVQWLRAMRDR